ncbi:hypothetical protein HK100_005372, partial [Physocladia obscura]
LKKMTQKRKRDLESQANNTESSASPVEAELMEQNISDNRSESEDDVKGEFHISSTTSSEINDQRMLDVTQEKETNVTPPIVEDVNLEPKTCAKVEAEMETEADTLALNNQQQSRVGTPDDNGENNNNSNISNNNNGAGSMIISGVNAFFRAVLPYRSQIAVTLTDILSQASWDSQDNLLPNLNEVNTLFNEFDELNRSKLNQHFRTDVVQLSEAVQNSAIGIENNYYKWILYFICACKIHQLKEKIEVPNP